MGDPMHALIALGVAIVLTPLARRIGLASGLVDRPSPGALKIHEAPVPFLGGVAVVAATFAALGMLGSSIPIAVSAAILGLMAVGLLDDIRSLPLPLRLGLQIAAGALIASVLPLDPLGPLGEAATVLLVVATTNAVNLLDGQDGLAGGLSAIAALGLVGLLASLGGSPLGGLGLSMAGSLVAFLAWNRPPARIFLGNGGAYAVGAGLAVLAADAASLGGAGGLLAAGVCLGVLAFEVVFTVVRRAVSKELESMATGDRKHSYDLLARRIGRVRSTLVIWCVGALASGIGTAAAAATLPGTVAIASGVGACSVLAGVWLYLGRVRASGEVRG
ncbi:MAG: glycosyltransferase family 4 protein [Actinomycetota bacterium]